VEFPGTVQRAAGASMIPRPAVLRL